ncbi:MAG: DNA mismatch repair protein MutT [Verrucomicrobiales bacterium]|jgi:ADP-ribose pyrophosphatase|nr:DNA mismatch repair protein MutT [Verrucomicrobiales bacterium]|tara:strand:+ start:12043 stop:12600 length:558 start_codon:yes stop_codon:yes gene_type:complete
MAEESEEIYRGKFLTYRKTSANWEYVTRTNARGAVAILALTDDRQVVLTEQYRPPVGRHVIELPAGLVGDIPLQEEEPLVTAAKRELKEETGYEAKNWTMLSEGTSSAGLTDEFVTLFYATGLTRMTQGGGVGGENIKVHFVHQSDVINWCRDRQSEGKFVDFKIFAALHLAKSLNQSTEARLWY